MLIGSEVEVVVVVMEVHSNRGGGVGDKTAWW